MPEANFLDATTIGGTQKIGRALPLNDPTSWLRAWVQMNIVLQKIFYNSQ